MPKKNSYILEKVERVQKGYLWITADSLEEAKEMLIDDDFSTAIFYNDEHTPDGLRKDFLRLPIKALEELKLAEPLQEQLTVEERAQAIWDETHRKLEVRNA